MKKLLKLKGLLKKFLSIILPAPLFRSIRLIKPEIIRRIRLRSVKSKIAKSLPLTEKRSKLRFEVHLVEHCNLNCKGCSDFAPLAEPEFLDVEEFRRDVTRLAELFGHECDRVYLMGGEPLLHPDLLEFMRITRQLLPEGDIYVFSNGILLPKMPDDFWKACHDNNIRIWVSAYPIKIDADTIKAKAAKFGVNFEWAWNDASSTKDIFDIVPINLGGDSDIKLQFGMCGRANNCIVLSHGRLFTCSFAPHVHHFNKYFGQNVVITEDDYIDIYQDLTADEICQKLSEPIPACRYCRKVEPVRTFTWGTSKRNINEWL